ncbi:hypothetical protein [Rhodoferax sp.]|uniref:hypothetical protein n=1 Tax=Rhodoferax sp. TaxID=50421 RepID=UPI0025D10D4B|nr:hypothetical protein [Rhodoferax sp.]
MSVSSVSSSSLAPVTPKSATASANAPAKASSPDGPSATPVAAPDNHFNVSMPPQAISNGLGQALGQHINLRA